MGSNMEKMLIIAACALLFVLAASTTSIMLFQTSDALEQSERWTSYMHRDVAQNKLVDVDMRNVEYIVKGTVAIQSIRHIEEIGVRIRVNGNLYAPNAGSTLPDTEVDPGILPTMPDERTGAFGINPNDNYAVSYTYQNGNLYEVIFTRK